VPSPTTIVRGTRDRTAELARRGQEWVDRQGEGSWRGVGIGAWRIYRRIDGPQESALLALYMLIAVLPAVLVMEEYLAAKPNALADHMVHHLGLSGATAGVLRGVLVHNKSHELGSALFAIAGALFFGLSFGRVLQQVHIRAWRLDLHVKETDQLRYAAVLGGLYCLILLLLVQLKELAGGHSEVGYVVTPGWAALLFLFFLWAPRFLTHGRIARRDLLPEALVIAVGLVALAVVSRYGMQIWVDLYARDYGGLGVVMALYFWIAIGSFLIIGAAALSPALAGRRALRS
jgi:uncharacterized BrkB/YihY/UPF0761 family membrane protein